MMDPVAFVVQASTSPTTAPRPFKLGTCADPPTTMLAPSRLHVAGTMLNPVQSMSGVLGLANDRTGRFVDTAVDEQPDNPRRARPRTASLLRIDILPNTSARIREGRPVAWLMATSSWPSTPPPSSSIPTIWVPWQATFLSNKSIWPSNTRTLFELQLSWTCLLVVPG